MKTIEDITFQRTTLQTELEQAIFKMQHNDNIKLIMQQLKDLQAECPHDFHKGKCIACGKQQ